MSTPALAPVENQYKQTGPRTPAGKERASNNATLHGGTSQKLIIPGELPSDFDALLNTLLTDHRPDTTESRIWVENVAKANWYLWRRQSAYNAIETALYAEQPSEALWSDAHLKRLSLADRYNTQAERALKRAQSYLDSRSKIQRQEAVPQQRSAEREAAHAIRERRVTLGEQKFDFAQKQAANRAFRFAKSALSSPSQLILPHPSPLQPDTNQRKLTNLSASQQSGNSKSRPGERTSDTLRGDEPIAPLDHLRDIHPRRSRSPSS